MHPTLDSSVQALVGRLPPVASTRTEFEEPVGEVAEEQEPQPLASQELEAIRSGLKQVLEKLREVLDRLQRATH
jgi:hypothetical protein